MNLVFKYKTLPRPRERERERKRGNKIYADGPRTFEVNNYKLVNVHPLLLPKSVVTKFG